MRIFRPLLLCAILTACGGGGGDSGAPATTPPPSGPSAPAPPPQAPAVTLALSSPTLRTLPGGSAIPISARLSSGGTVRWQLAAGAPGKLSADSGNTVSYQPPAGTLAAPVTVAVTATGDGASATLTLAVTPDPGAPGLYPLTWRLPGTENTPTMLRASGVATDLAGNIYVMLMVDASPSRRGPPRMIRIAPDGTVSEIFGDKWFGQPDTSNNAYRLYFPQGFALDRAGNLYVVNLGGFGLEAGEHFSSGPAILKITPAGILSVLAGTEGEQTGAMTDGTGSAARFLNPTIVGIDLDDNLYVLDKNDTLRKVTSAGVVTTPATLPPGLQADLNGNTYRWDQASSRLIRTGPDGVTEVETRIPYCSNFVPAPPLTCLNGPLNAITAIGGASYVLFDGSALRRLVLPH